MEARSRKKQLLQKASVLFLFIASLFIIFSLHSCNQDLTDETDNTKEVSEVARKYAQHIDKRGMSISIEKYNEIMNLFEDTSMMTNLFFLDFPVIKTPSDLWITQNIIAKTQPEYIIETGTYLGGSALYWAFVLNGLGLTESRIITIDIEDYLGINKIFEQPLWIKYVHFMKGSSTSPDIIARVKNMIKDKKVMVILDSAHNSEHVLNEMKLYGPLVAPGSYMIVEDTFIDGIPVRPEDGPGPMTAVIEYLEGEGGALFEQDMSCESLIFSRNAGGWLKRKR